MIDLKEDLGVVEFRIGEATVAIDVLRTNNQIADIQTRCEGKPSEVSMDEVCLFIESLGFARPSHHKANQFITALTDAKKELLGNAGPAQVPTT